MSYIDIEDTKLYYEEIGKGLPVLLLHGWACDCRYTKGLFEPVFKELSNQSPSMESSVGSDPTTNTAATKTADISLKEKYRRIYVDLPGMGRSEPGSVKNASDTVRLLADLMNRLAPNQSFLIGGHSFGGRLCMGLTALHSEKICGLMLIMSSVGITHYIPVENKIAKMDAEFLASLDPVLRTDFTAMNANLTKESFDRFMTHAYPSVFEGKNNPFLHGTFKGSFTEDIDALAEANPFPGPVLILNGRNDSAVGYKAQFKLLDRYPCATYAALYGVGHNAHIDDPVLTSSYISGWIRKQTWLK